MSADTAWYIDTSAFLKLVVVEPESDALAAFARGKHLMASALAVTEVGRALHGFPRPVLRRASSVLQRIDLLHITMEVLEQAAVLEPAELRSLDAIHLATAAAVNDVLAGVITYDRRMGEAALMQGWQVAAPA